MACFVVPAAEAIIVTAAYFAAKKRETKIEAKSFATEGKFENNNKITWSKRLSWLLGLLWGGVLLLAFEHIWHGEVILYPPFLSAMSTPEDTATMLHEMATVGTSMAVFVTAVWGAVCGFVQAKVKKQNKSLKKAEDEA
jgi:hypothetical protein